MKFRVFITVFSLFLLAFSVDAQARSGPKPTMWGWWPWHWENQDFKPYLDDPQIPHNSQWTGDPWRPSDWDDAQGSPRRTLDHLYAAGILTDQYIEDGVPVLEVGYNFMRLSGQEQRRVVTFVDDAYAMTRDSRAGTIYVHYQITDEPIGIYTAEGLQLQ